MRWYSKRKPNIGDIRIIEGFLLLPRCINREWRWLEFAEYSQHYVGHSLIGEPASEPGVWVNKNWLTL